ncbi:uncharacterized protein LY89DRAFT_690330 [Mollisia scopiformis]|uniref:Uncharacterized protein n=1 Tax=Mollisia scopiformis TaxID=149040 RepID=A0A132BBA3_MOLSC|nr:uncharacterized protein LY89DRAFT_690330 [Mollisia scopiformis]KUJ09279.1 hypothetical protein LY89DRAFT_690330 [Mollisia scopiformis]
MEFLSLSLPLCQEFVWGLLLPEMREMRLDMSAVPIRPLSKCLHASPLPRRRRRRHDIASVPPSNITRGSLSESCRSHVR